MIRPGATLDSLGVTYNCDKSSAGRRRGDTLMPAHDYLRKYAFFLERFCHADDLRFMELGIGPDWNMGASLKMWLDYFPRADARFTMVDLNPEAQRFAGPRVAIRVGDLGDPGFLRALATQPQDVILDDASHRWRHQIETFLALFDAVRPGGLYIIEDIHTSFGAGRRTFGAEGQQDTVSFLTGLMTILVGGNAPHPQLSRVEQRDVLAQIAASLDSVTMIAKSCILCKSGYY